MLGVSEKRKIFGSGDFSDAKHSPDSNYNWLLWCFQGNYNYHSENKIDFIIKIFFIFFFLHSAFVTLLAEAYKASRFYCRFARKNMSEMGTD